MSTAERYGTAVWDACLDVQKHQACRGLSHFSVGQVGARAGVSPKTARKYIKALVEKGYIVQFVAPEGSCFYSVRREFRKGLSDE